MIEMRLDESTRRFDCEATLTDTQVLDFCRNGFLVLEGVVPDEINKRTFDYLNGKIPINPSYMPEGFTREILEGTINTIEPSAILLEDWFIEHVLLNPVAAGAVRSLLGKDTGLPILMSNHRAECPSPAQDWHQDGESLFSPETNYLQVFYYPQDTPEEMGPTEVVPGTHVQYHKREGDWSEGVSTASPAGSIFITSYPVVHRKSESTASGLRHLLKYNYWRTVPPERDWIVEPEFDFQTASYSGHHPARYYAHMFYWLCGKSDEFRTMGGQSWPNSQISAIGKPYGFPPGGGRVPDWKNSQDF